MTTNEMTKRTAGVHSRSGSSVWQWRIRPPIDLRHLYPGEWAYRQSLGTSDLREANAKGAVLLAEWLGRFADQRKALNAVKVERVTPEMGKLLAERVAATILAKDEKLRNEPETLRLLLQALTPYRPGYGLTIGPYEAPAAIASTAPIDPMEGVPLELVLELAELNEGLKAYASQQMATQRIAAVLPLVKHEARALGLEFDEKVPGAKDALRECLKAFRKAAHDVTLRDDGEVIETPEAPTAVAMKQAKPTKLRDVLQPWKSSKTRRAQTEQAAELALALYEKSTGNPPLKELTRAQGVECRAFLLSQGTTPKTARDRFDYIKGFLNFAAREMEILAKNPWEGLAIEYKTTKPRRPWSAEQLNALFSKPLFAQYSLPQDWHAGADAAYWIPVLGAFTGARVGELCQLMTADVETVDGVAVIHITDQGEGQLVKTEAGRRVVPVHQELQRLGFLDYVDAIRKAGSVRLFPALQLAPTKASNYFSAWFKTVRDEKDEGHNVTLPDFHSFRHTVRSKLASASIAEPMIDTLLGHEVKGSTGAKKYTERTTEDLKRAMSALTYVGLTLPRVFVAPTAVAAREPSKRGRRPTASRIA